MKRTLNELRNNLSGKIYLYLKDEKTKKEFISAARSEGYKFGKEGLPENVTDNIISLKKNKNLCYVGYIGRIEFQCAESRYLHRIDYAKYSAGYEQYYYENEDNFVFENVITHYHGNVLLVGKNSDKAGEFLRLSLKNINSLDREKKLLELVVEKYNIEIGFEEEY